MPLLIVVTVMNLIFVKRLIEDLGSFRLAVVNLWTAAHFHTVTEIWTASMKQLDPMVAQGCKKSA
jgi:hypothetical protein